jgi:carbon storage regulator
MLVLTRKEGEQIRIGDNITVSIIEIDRGSIRMGIDAPRHVTILRQEVYERIQEENLESSRGMHTEVEKAADYWRKQSGKE